MKPEIKKLLILNAPYLLFVYLFDIRGKTSMQLQLIWRPEVREPFFPPLGGASRAPGLPQAAARHICGRGPHPLPWRGGVTLMCRIAGQDSCDGRAGPVCRFRGEGKAVTPETEIPAVLGRVWSGS